MLRRLLLSFIICHISLSHVAAQEFRIDNFHENTMEMAAATSGVKDLNGKLAALIRFVVRDDKFDFDANLGILKKTEKTGEVWLFVPEGTKRISISHPYLGVLRGYELPLSITSKTTYDAEIVITNETYLRTLMQQAAQNGGNHPPKPVTDSVPTRQTDKVPLADSLSLGRISPDSLRMKESIPKERLSDFVYYNDTPQGHSRKSLPARFGIGIDYSVLGTVGPSANIELIIDKMSICFGGVLCQKKATDIGVYNKHVHYLEEAYDYSCMKAFAGIGFLLNPRSLVQFTLKGGLAVGMISGKELAKKNTTYFDDEKKFDHTHVATAFVALRVGFALGKHVLLHVTPEYNFDVNHGDTYELIKEADNTIKDWGDGLGVKAGLLFTF